jgi:hypothetical protein
MTCPEREYRDSLTDDEFWAYVATRLNGADPFQDLDPIEEAEARADAEQVDDGLGGVGPCPVCNAAGACAWDTEGRALIHVVTADENE